MKVLFLSLIFLVFASNVGAQPSPDNTRVPPAPSLSVAVSRTDVWTLGAASAQFPGNFDILRNGVSEGGARGSKIMLCKGTVYVLGRLKTWFTWAGTWTDTKLGTMPCDGPPPPQIITGTMSFTWVPGAVTKLNAPTGFRVYRDGVLIATVAANVISYTDPLTLPTGAVRCYTAAAFNSSGEGGRSPQSCDTVRAT